MNLGEDSYYSLVERIRQRDASYLDLLTARTDDEFERAFEAVMDFAVRHLERNRNNFRLLDEVGLSAVVAGTLSFPGGLTVIQEAHSNGHVDLTIEADFCMPPRIKLAEAKIYNGPSYHVRGLQQLLGRYTTGREGRGLIISYVRQRNIRGLTDKLQLHMNQNLPLKQTAPCRSLSLKWAFITVHLHDCGEELEVGHIGCNLSLTSEFTS